DTGFAFFWENARANLSSILGIIAGCEKLRGAGKMGGAGKGVTPLAQPFQCSPRAPWAVAGPVGDCFSQGKGHGAGASSASGSSSRLVAEPGSDRAGTRASRRGWATSSLSYNLPGGLSFGNTKPRRTASSRWATATSSQAGM